MPEPVTNRTGEFYPPIEQKTAKQWQSHYSTVPKEKCVARLAVLERERKYAQELQRNLTREQHKLSARLAVIAKQELDEG